MNLTLREATAEDEGLLLEWRNEAVTRAQSFSSDAITSDQHRRWFASGLEAREATRIWILICDGLPAGQVRYEKKDGGIAEVSISIDASFRGRGLSVELLRLSAPRACRELLVQEIRGFVRLSNAASLAAFEKAGFVRAPDRITAGEACAVFVWRCPAPT